MAIVRWRIGSQASTHLGVVFEGRHEQGKDGREEEIEASDEGTLAGGGERDAPLLEARPAEVY